MVTTTAATDHTGPFVVALGVVVGVACFFGPTIRIHGAFFGLDLLRGLFGGCFRDRFDSRLGRFGWIDTNACVARSVVRTSQACAGVFAATFF